MSLSAQRAQLDFVQLAAEEPSSLYFEAFLRHGYDAWPSHCQRRFPGLATWRGVAGLKRSLRTLVGAPNDWNVLLASRSLSIVKLAARCMFRVCRNVLATDLSWPTYHQDIERHARRRGVCVTVVPLRERVLYQQWTAGDVSRYLAAAFAQSSCDGLFLPAVDHLGVRLPIREIVATIQRCRKINYCFIDAAQAFCQMSIDDCFECADFVVAGSHKWMGAYLPMGIGFVGARPPARGVLDDGLLRFTEQLDGGELDGHSETTNLTSLFACAGAVQDQTALLATPTNSSVRHRTLDCLPKSLQEWQPVLTYPAMQSRIVLLESTNERTRRATADSSRRRWLMEGMIVSAYEGGRVRVSLPLQPIDHIDRVAPWADRDSARACGKSSSGPHY